MKQGYFLLGMFFGFFLTSGLYYIDKNKVPPQPTAIAAPEELTPDEKLARPQLEYSVQKPVYFVEVKGKTKCDVELIVPMKKGTRRFCEFEFKQ